MGIMDSLQKAIRPGQSSGSSDGGPLNNTIERTNQYRILLDINGVRCSDERGNEIIYQLICDYENANFPIRQLSVNLQYNQAQAIFNTPLTPDRFGNNRFYDIQMVVVPMGSNQFQNKAFLDGKFKGMIQENDTKLDFQSGNALESAMRTNDVSDLKTKVTFYLYRENEIQYSLDNRLNFVLTNPTIETAFRLALSTSNPTTKLLMSPPVSKDAMGLTIVSPQGFHDFIQYLEHEIGFYKTKYINYMEQGILFFLNRENAHGVKQSVLQNVIALRIGRSIDKRVDRYVKKLNETKYEMGVSAADVHTWVDSEDVFQKSKLYVSPSGKEWFFKRGMSRDPDTIYKALETPPVEKYPNLIYERIRITLPMMSVNFINPLTLIAMTDSMGKLKVYRVSKYTTTVKSTLSCLMQIEGFFVIDNESNQKPSPGPSTPGAPSTGGATGSFAGKAKSAMSKLKK